MAVATVVPHAVMIRTLSAAPLGWVMSGHSLRSSEQAMHEQIREDCRPDPQGYGCYGNLLAVLTAD